MKNIEDQKRRHIINIQKNPILYSFKRCPYAMRARMALKIANIKCEIREVRLNNKPKHMLNVSPKGTVPILIFEDRIIEESMEIIDWVLKEKNIFQDHLSSDEKNITADSIKLFDTKFKNHLDRYKYSTRYENINIELHRTECIKILIELEKHITSASVNWIFGNSPSKLDISILPFVRQFRIANPNWFDQQSEIKKVRKVLNNFIQSNLFKQIMHDYEVWNEGDRPVYFPLDQ